MRPISMRAAVAGAVLTMSLLAGNPAMADTRWQEAAGGAVAILPAPSDAKGIVGGSLSCAEQRWTLLLRTEPGAVPAGAKEQARLVVGDEVFETTTTEAGGTLALAVSRQILGPLKSGSRLGVSIGDKGKVAKAVFSLRGSGAVLDAIVPRCTPVDMSPYQAVTLSENAPSVEIAAGLMQAEAKLFRAAAGKQPVFASAMLPLNGGRKLMFASLCGSTSYYGPSGCTLSGFAAEGEDGAWREVYNTEGLSLFLDHAAAKDAWPGLVTLPQGGDAPSRWAWTGTEYALTGGEGLQAQAEEGDSGQ